MATRRIFLFHPISKYMFSASRAKSALGKAAPEERGAAPAPDHPHCVGLH